MRFCATPHILLGIFRDCVLHVNFTTIRVAIYAFSSRFDSIARVLEGEQKFEKRKRRGGPVLVSAFSIPAACV
jgi:hypothetical protein